MILTSGVFDGLHVGHVGYLSAATKHAAPGEVFAVAIAPDAYVERVKHRKPEWSLLGRMGVVAALGIVDRVMAHGDDGAADAIRSAKPRLFIKGIDWKANLPDDVRKACYDVGCAIVFVDSGIDQHTSDRGGAA